MQYVDQTWRLPNSGADIAKISCQTIPSTFKAFPSYLTYSILHPNLFDNSNESYVPELLQNDRIRVKGRFQQHFKLMCRPREEFGVLHNLNSQWALLQLTAALYL